jgi:hypothetical protein
MANQHKRSHLLTFTKRPPVAGQLSQGALPTSGGFIRLLRNPMSQKASAQRNEYRLSMETNQNGKYLVRIRVRFNRRGWALPAYFLASSFDRAIKKLEQTLQLLQRHEDRLWFWGVERSDDPNVAADMLAEFGLQLDRRAEFTNRSAALAVPPDRPVPAFLFAPVRRRLAEAVSSSRAVAAGD